MLLRRLRVEDERQTVPQSFARAVHAAVGEKGVGAVEHRHLVHARADGAVFRNGAERREVCLRAGGEHELKARIAAEGGKAGTVEGERVVVDRAERDVDEGASRQLFKGRLRGAQEGTDEVVFFRKGVGAWLKLRRGVDDSFRLVVVGDDVKHALDRVARRAQALELTVDPRLGEQELQEARAVLPDDLGAEAVEGKGRGGADKGDAVLFRGELRPERHRIAHDDVGAVGGQLAAEPVVGGEREVDDELGGKGEVAAQTCVVGGGHAGARGLGVKGDKDRACGLDLRAEGFGRVVADGVSARGQLAHDGERRVRVPVGGDAEKGDIHSAFPPKMRSNRRAKSAFGGIAMPCVSSARKSSVSPG